MDYQGPEEMKMRKSVLFVTVLLTVLLMIAGCGNSGSGDEGQDQDQYTLTLNVADDGKSAGIIATDADEGDFAMSGTLIIGENEKVVSLPALNDGSVTIELVRSDDLGLEEDASLEELENAGGTDAAFTIKAEGLNTTEVTPESGEYYLRVTTSKGADGAVTLSVDPIQ